MSDLRAPFPWFGGKRRVANVVWRAFGADVPNLIDPFAGSLAILLGRPGGAGKIEAPVPRAWLHARFHHAAFRWFNGLRQIRVVVVERSLQ